MWHRLKQLFCRDTTLLYIHLIAQIAILVLSLARIDPGFWPKTTLARLHANIVINTVLILVLAISAITLKRLHGEDRRTAALVIAGLLWGIGAASAWGFDPGLFSSYSFSAGALFWAANLRSRYAPQIVVKP